MLVQHQVSADMHPTERHRLRDRPLHRASRWSDGESRSSPPESRRRIVVLVGGVGMHVAGDARGVGRSAQPDHLGVEADGHIDRIVARQEKERVALRPEFVMLLRGVYGVDLLLNRLRRHRGIEDQDVGPEWRLVGLCGKHRKSDGQKESYECGLSQRLKHVLVEHLNTTPTV